MARSNAARISRPVSASVPQMSASSCQSSTASAAASADDSLASVEEIQVRRAASISAACPTTAASGKPFASALPNVARSGVMPQLS